jgi:DNA polymerase-3 subunit delta
MAAAAPTVNSILKDIRARKFSSVYLLHGEEPYFIEQICSALEDTVLTESEKVFNQIILYGKDADARTVIDYCRQYPMMSQYKVVIIKEAQMMNSDQFLSLEPYLEKSAPTTVLVLCYMHKKVDGRTNFMKTAKSKAVVFESKKLYSNQVPEWIEAIAAEQQATIDADAVEVMYEYIGNDLPRIANEITKLKIGLGKNERITSAMVYDNIGINREYNVFELQKTVGMKDHVGTEMILKNLLSNMKSTPLVLVIGTFFSYFTKLLVIKSLHKSTDQELAQALGQNSTFFIKEYKAAAAKYTLTSLENIIAILRTYDMKSKGINSRNKDDGELLREMIQRIFYA